MIYRIVSLVVTISFLGEAFCYNAASAQPPAVVATSSPLSPPETPEVAAGDEMFPQPFTMRVDHDDLISFVGSVVDHNGKPVRNPSNTTHTLGYAYFGF